AELSLNEGAYDLSSEPVTDGSAGKAGTRVYDFDVELVFTPSRADKHFSLAAREPVFNGVRNNLGERERERRRVFGGQFAEGSLLARVHDRAVEACDLCREAE